MESQVKDYRIIHQSCLGSPKDREAWRGSPGSQKSDNIKVTEHIRIHVIYSVSYMATQNAAIYNIPRDI